MPIVLYNSLTRKKEEFVPLVPGRVHIYVCGPTVYSHAHIGHAKSYLSFDMIVRYFRYRGYKVKYVQNITDVGHLTDDADEGEDKILKKAREEKLDPMEIAEYFAWSYFDDMQKLGVLRANIFPRATGHIVEQIDLIQRLLVKGYAYEVNGNIYYDVSRFAGYGKLSGRKVEELDAGARVEINPEKRHPADFALWKKAEPQHLMRWNSPWGEGYPGWHIECSAMSMKYLGETFDIHGGGLDNIFPHHECEIAQSEAASGKPFVRYWLHNNMVTVNGSKMSKSTGNFITIKDALQQFNTPTLRYFIFSSHYRSRLDFSNEALQAARVGLDKLLLTIKNVKKKIDPAGQIKNFHSPFDPSGFRKQFEEMMDDDFNTPRALAVLFELSGEVNSYLNSGLSLHQPFLQTIDQLLRDTAGQVLGLIPEDLLASAEAGRKGDIEKIVQVVIDIRKKLRDHKQYQLADQVRSDLGKVGITLVDKPEGTTFEYQSE
ncbi:MAG: cysteine--tRNA ligase [Caldithrix sp. RBG_13_44_9]|nr:MAG: cysteine--tRNA ligase [Caldithrix sp. RBG_13_44_9]